MNFFKILVGSFYNPGAYVLSRGLPMSKGLIYSLLLVMLSTAVIMIAGGSFIHRTFLQAEEGKQPPLDAFVMNIAEQVPVMVLQDGVLQVKAEQPHVIYFEFEGKRYPFITIDTTGHSDLHTMHTPVLVTAREIYAKSRSDTKVYRLEELGSKSTSPLIINRAMATDAATRALEWLHGNAWKIYLWVGIPAWLVGVFVAYMLRVIMLMALGLVGLIVSEALKQKVTFETSVQIATVSYTPIALVSTAALCFTGHTTHTLLLFTLGTMMLCVGFVVSRE